ncbi:hypothetical protein HME9302_00332 [Alteripontixanthobacter maritimus]|uniref:Flagellin N-terminal domain-containing protein n=1 Tax=Alteripontixanthobacter maritimus TaxID=2161824 RepID=A0A369Q776_9SPHN|nr:flagellar biosynthesis protein FlgL [Alteripontixanthobacter maritimus]RDC59147.1 hypothetical protein HME9302_00332 [Alteripontixanthobacter maritimus]
MTLPTINSSSAFFRRSLTDMTSLRGQAEQLQQSIGTGTRIARSSDDPVAAAQLRGLGRADRLASIDSANTARAADELSRGGDALSDIAGELIRIRELTLLASSEATGAQQRSVIADEIDQLQQSLLAAVNTRGLSGGALFGGETDGPAYRENGRGVIFYDGTAQAGEFDLGDDIAIPRGITGPTFTNFDDNGTQTNVFAFLTDLSAALRSSADPAAAATGALAGLDEALGQVNRSQTVLGARAAWIEIIQTRQDQLSESRSRASADVGGTDLTSAIAELQQTLTVLEASQASFVRMQNLSLFDAI